MPTITKKLSELYELQLLDNEIIENVRRIKILEKEETPVQKKFRDLTARVEKLDKDQEPIKKEISLLNDENIKQLQERKECEDKLFAPDSSSDPKMLQSLQAKREQISKQMKMNEDEKIKKQIDLDNIEAKKNDYKTQLEEIKDEYEQVTREREEEKETLKERIEELKKERLKFKDFEDKKLLALYQKLQKENEGVAIASVDNDVCDGCFVELSSATIERLRHNDEIVKCQRCGRILYIPGEDTETKDD